MKINLKYVRVIYSDLLLSVFCLFSRFDGSIFILLSITLVSSCICTSDITSSHT